jgi:uncharacterized protein YqjF (DUF2071 family)
MAQRWHELLFAHWPMPVSAVRALIPARLTLDTFEGQAWLGVIPFHMSGVRLRGTPALPFVSAFPELNVRTYVVCGEKRGAWFFSLDAGNALAVAVARAWFHLPYYRARMRVTRDGDWIEYRSERTHSGAPAAELALRYRPRGTAREPEPGSLEHWLTERYCLYAVDGHGQMFRGEIHHPAWKLSSAEAEFTSNTMAAALGVALPEAAPILYFAERQEVVVWVPWELETEKQGSREVSEQGCKE